MMLSRQLEEGLAVLRLDLPATLQAKLLGFVALLKKWNRVYNLTSIRDEGAMVTQHLLDSLAILPGVPEAALAGKRWADVGSGAGLPGIPLAIARPDLQMTLIESVGKKSAFQRQAKIELGLSNLAVVSGRVESQPGNAFDAVVSRAFADLRDFVSLAGHLPVRDGRLYAMKGAPAATETGCLPPAWTVVECLALQVPGLDAQRHLIVLERA
jgi:16S rRNA (guanine527-N7)-methyltransferase